MARKPKTNSTINGNDYFRTRLQIGIDSEGKPIIKNFYGRTKTEALNKKSDYIKDIEVGLNPDLSSQSLGKALSLWLWNVEKHSGNKSSTFERYESINRNYIQNTSLGQLIVADIKKIAIQKYYNSLADNGKTYSMVENINKLLNKFFKYAAEEGYIIKNPLSGIRLPKDNENNIDEDFNSIETFTDKELKEISKTTENKKLKYIIMFAVLTGCRMGEILALENSDLTEDVIRINKSVRNVKIFDDKNNSYWEEKVTTPKSKSSNREIPIPEVLKKELRKLDLLVKEERLKMGKAYTNNNLLFPSLTGTYLNARNLRRSWTRALRDSNITYKKFHSLRHTYATRLFENCASILTVSRLLGHSSISTTEIYTHVLEDIKAKEVECLNNMFL